MLDNIRHRANRCQTATELLRCRSDVLADVIGMDIDLHDVLQVFRDRMLLVRYDIDHTKQYDLMNWHAMQLGFQEDRDDGHQQRIPGDVSESS